MGIKATESYAKKAALESIVLLKNKDNILPISKKIESIAVIGPDAVEARLGGYSGPGNSKVSILQGIKNIAKSIRVDYSEGCGRGDFGIYGDRFKIFVLSILMEKKEMV